METHFIFPPFSHFPPFSQVFTLSPYPGVQKHLTGFSVRRNIVVGFTSSPFFTAFTQEKKNIFYAEINQIQ